MTLLGGYLTRKIFLRYFHVALLATCGILLFYSLHFLWHQYQTTEKTFIAVTFNNKNAIVKSQMSEKISPLKWNEIHHDIPDLEIFVRLYHKKLMIYKELLVKSLSIFWPDTIPLKMVIVLDNESAADHALEASLKNSYPFPRIMYEDPSNVYHKNGHIRQQRTMLHAAKYAKSEYVGFVDSDTLFVTMVTPDLIFDGSKPVAIGQYGKDLLKWRQRANNTEKWFGHKEVMKCMTYFPVIMKTKHLDELTKWVEDYHGLPFDKVFEKLSVNDHFSQFSMMCQYVWMFHRDEYTFYLQESYEGKSKVSEIKMPIGRVSQGYYDNHMKPENWIPKPRAAMHVGNPIPKPSSRYEVNTNWIENYLGDGFCRSVGFQYCPEKCTNFHINQTQLMMFLFAGHDWSWHPQALTQQLNHYETVHAMVKYLNDTKQRVLGADSIEDACRKWPKGYNINFLYPRP